MTTESRYNQSSLFVLDIKHDNLFNGFVYTDIWIYGFEVQDTSGFYVQIII